MLLLFPMMTVFQDLYYSTIWRLLWISIWNCCGHFLWILYLRILALPDKCLLSVGLLKGSQFCYSTLPFDEYEASDTKIDDDDFMAKKRELEPQGVDPKRGWGFRGVHKVFSLYCTCKLCIYLLFWTLLFMCAYLLLFLVICRQSFVAKLGKLLYRRSWEMVGQWPFLLLELGVCMTKEL